MKLNNICKEIMKNAIIPWGSGTIDNYLCGRIMNRFTQKLTVKEMKSVIRGWR